MLHSARRHGLDVLPILMRSQFWEVRLVSMSDVVNEENRKNPLNLAVEAHRLEDDGKYGKAKLKKAAYYLLSGKATIPPAYDIWSVDVMVFN